MRRVLPLLLCLACASAAAEPSGLDALLQQVKDGQAQTAKIDSGREDRFLRDKTHQAELVMKAEADLSAAKSKADEVRARYDAQQKEITDLKAQLKDRAGDYVQVNAAVRQVAGDMRSLAADSLVTAQFPERMAFLSKMAGSSDLPSVRQLEELWFTLQQQMTESGKVVHFPAKIVDAEGVPRDAQVTRVGTFTAMADGEYLTISDDGRKLTALPRQPGRHLQGIAQDFADSSDAVAPVLVDPSRGSLLLIEGEKPSLGERIRQGGLVGYVIIVLGVIGILIAIGQMVYLEIVGRGVRRQLVDARTPRNDNPLGRVLNVFRDDPDHRDDDPELLELRLSEAVLREMPPLERAQSILRLFAAAAPLLGLLGTVTGMIVTFQTITVFGTGDPKLMANGISQALVTTVLGLVVAIPLLFINSILATRARSLVQVLDEQTAGLLARRMEAARA